ASDPDADVKSGKLSDVLTAEVAADALVVVDGACPEGAPGGDLLIVNPPEGECMGAHVGKSLAEPLITSWEAGDARLRFLSLDGVYLAKAHAVEPEGK